MRKLVILAGLAFGVGLLAGVPAQAATVGCSCVKVGANPVCTATVVDCNQKVGGVCMWTCAYEPPKMAKAKKKKM